MAVFNLIYKNSVHHMNQNSPSVFSSVNKTLVVEPWSSTDFLSQCGFFFLKSEISKLNASLRAGLVVLPSHKAHHIYISIYISSK